MAKINFVALGDASLASQRFRVYYPYELLSKDVDNTVTIKKFPDFDADINIFQKHLHPEQILHWMKTVPTKKVFDVCDDHFDREMGEYYKEACNLADVLTCTNKRMEKRLKELFPTKKVVVAHDPINVMGGEPHWSEKPKLIWFGHSTNIQDSSPWLQEAMNGGYDLTIFTNVEVHGDGFKFVPYQNGWLEENLKNYDVVILPTGDTFNNRKWINMKSENRFVDGLQAGCCVIFNNDILYNSFDDFGIYEPGSLGKALERYKKNKEDVLKTIKKGQEYINKNYSDGVITKQWKKILD